MTPRPPVAGRRHERAPAAAPTPRAQPAPAGVEPATKRRWIVAIMGGEERKGRWRVAPAAGPSPSWEASTLDLRDGAPRGRRRRDHGVGDHGRRLRSSCPRASRSRATGFVLMGGRTNRIKGTPLPGSPVVRVKGYGMWGGVDVSEPQAGARRRRRRDHRRRGAVHDAAAAGTSDSSSAAAAAPPPPSQPPRVGRRVPRPVRPTGGTGAGARRARSGHRGGRDDRLHRHRRIDPPRRHARRPAVARPSLGAHNAIVRDQLGRHERRPR